MSRQARNVMLLVGVLAGCSVQDVDLARQQLASGDPAQQKAGQQTLRSMSGQGYDNATLALAGWYGQQGNIAALRQIKDSMARAAAKGSQAELNYLRWLLNASARIPEWVPEVDRRLLQRQQDKADVFDLLARLYQREPALDSTQLVTLFQHLDVTQTVQADSWLHSQTRIDALFKVATADQLKQACTAVEATTSYPDCLTAKLFWLRSGRPEAVKDINSWVDQVKQAFASQRLQVEDLAILMDALTSAHPGGPQKPIALELANLAPQAPAIALRRYALLIPTEGQDDETAQMETHLLQLRKAGYSRAGVLLGRLYLNSPRKVPDMDKAQRFFAASVQDPEGAYWLGTIQLSGQLGEATAAKVNKGVALLVQSGRGGFRRADIYLADLFANGLGVVRNPVYAQVFAQLAMQPSDNPAMKRLVEGLALDVRGQQQASSLLQQEQAWRVQLDWQAQQAPGNPDPVLAGRSDPQSEDQG
ncbi:TPA: sel1 repeat family protein [Escherichia coli]|nr:sel1 repeat family protein [Escherichia coli]